MGATTFINKRKAERAQDAFCSLVQDALDEYGHAGYTGTIAEKHEYVELDVPSGYSVGRWIESLLYSIVPQGITEQDRKEWDRQLDIIDDKWGPAGCIKVDKDDGGYFVFFGWASE